jgi:hypothetical protein
VGRGALGDDDRDGGQAVTFRPTLIVSGGQTGADRAGLDVAIALGIPHNGYCPAGRRAEDGRIPDRYNLRETRSADYEDRTARNVKHIDATVIFTPRSHLSPGSKLTRSCCKAHGRQWLHFCVGIDSPDYLSSWLDVRRPKILNVAGSRESKSPGIGALVREILLAVWA